MIRTPQGCFEIRDSCSRLVLSNSHGNIEFSYVSSDGDGVCFAVDPDDLREALDALAPRAEGDQC